MNNNSPDKYRKLIESIRLVLMLALGYLLSIRPLLAIVLAVIFGLIDQFFVKPRLSKNK